MRKSPGYRIFTWVLLILSLLLLWQSGKILTRPKYIPIDDFVRHWAAGQLFITGGNPYAPSEIQVLQDLASGKEAKSPVITPNYIPPWTMPILGFFGLFGYPISRLAWLVFNITVLLVSAELTWKLYGGNPRFKWVAWVACFTFGASVSALGKGQTSCLVLLGIAGFLYFTEFKPNGWIAGAFVVLISFKPQVFYLFWPVFLFWIVRYRRFKEFLGCALSIVILTVISLLFDSHIFNEYYHALLDYPPTLFATPTIGGYLRYFIFEIDQFWLQFIPVLIGLLWCGVYLYRNRSTWNWSNHVTPLLFASVLTSSYSWTYDQVILVVPVLQAWTLILTIKDNWRGKIFILVHFLLSSLDLILHRYLDDFWFIWFAPATLVWYLAVRYSVKHNG